MSQMLVIHLEAMLMTVVNLGAIFCNLDAHVYWQNFALLQWLNCVSKKKHIIFFQPSVYIRVVKIALLNCRGKDYK